MTFIYSAQCSMPTVTTESATDVTSTTATLNGTVNANSFSTTAWFAIRETERVLSTIL